MEDYRSPSKIGAAIVAPIKTSSTEEYPLLLEVALQLLIKVNILVVRMKPKTM
jgi:hypothetical protein